MAEALADSKAGWRQRMKRWSVRAAIILVVLLLLGGSLVGVAEHRTSQPQFCASCHIMEPYYESWHADMHGSKLDVACVECHYAPGEQFTFHAKLRGLSQVASYFSGRYGATRPRAHVSNESCLTSKCHGDRKFMDKAMQLGTVQFTHAKHLQRNDERERNAGERLSALESELKGLVGDERFGELQAVARQAGPAAERYDTLVRMCRDWNASVPRESVVEYSQLVHRDVRIAQLGDLQCTSCHSYHSPSNA